MHKCKVKLKKDNKKGNKFREFLLRLPGFIQGKAEYGTYSRNTADNYFLLMGLNKMLNDR